jgi:hypothetical protein
MGKYKEKSCKFCQTKHRKKGPYCCQSCANRDRPEYSANVSSAMRKVANEYNKTPEAIAKQKQLNTPLASMTADEFAVDIPDVSSLDDYLDYTEGYDKAEKW